MLVPRYDDDDDDDSDVADEVSSELSLESRTLRPLKLNKE